MAISDVQLKGMYYIVYNSNKDKIKELPTSSGELCAFGSDFILFVKGMYYTTYDETGNKIKDWPVSSGGYLNSNGSSINFRKDSYIVTYDRNFNKLSERFGHFSDKEPKNKKSDNLEKSISRREANARGRSDIDDVNRGLDAFSKSIGANNSDYEKKRAIWEQGKLDKERRIQREKEEEEATERKRKAKKYREKGWSFIAWLIELKPAYSISLIVYPFLFLIGPDLIPLLGILSLIILAMLLIKDFTKMSWKVFVIILVVTIVLPVFWIWYVNVGWLLFE
jgi:hypothetical protein